VSQDVSGAIAGRVFRRGRTRAFHRPPSGVQLRLAGRLCQFFDRLPLAIPAQEVHPRVDAGGVVAQRLIHEADGFEVLAPVERRAQAKARHRVGNRHLRRGLSLMLLAYRAVDGGLANLKMRVERRADA